jgi:TonB-dependent receptor
MEGPTDQTGNAPVHLTRLSYASRALDFGQLRGEHEFPALANAQLDWFGALSYATRDEPDTRANFYLWRPDLAPPAWGWQANAQSGSHLFAEQAEIQRSGGLDWTQPLGRADKAPKAKLGGLISVRDREFDARRFEFARAPGRLEPDQLALFNCEGRAFRADCSDKLFDSSNVGPVVRVSEKTRENDGYDASLDVYAGYLMLDAEVLKGLRAVGGARIEVTKQSIESFDPFAITEMPISGKIDETDVLPALALTHAASSKANTRFAVSRTLARPQLRELAPFVFNPYFGGYPTQGNPDLTLTYITNIDLRFEFFPTMREVLAFSFFYKNFDDPIEELLRSRGDSNYVTYANADGADLIGVELEARKNLDSFTSALKDFSVLANLTLVKSRVQLSEVGISTNPSRPLSNQAPYIVNLALDYSLQATKTQARVLYNVNGPRIVTVGSDGLQDIYEKPRHLVDLTVVQGLGKNFELKANVQNLLNAPLRTTQRGVDPDGPGPERGKEFVTGDQRHGTTFTLAASYTH